MPQKLYACITLKFEIAKSNEYVYLYPVTNSFVYNASKQFANNFADDQSLCDGHISRWCASDSRGHWIEH